MSIAKGTLYRHLLIIDDDLEDQEIFIEAVHEVDSAIHCYTFGSGDAALLQLSNPGIELPDLIFLDMNMPKLNGRQVLREIKQMPLLKNIPVIMYSTSFAPRDLEEMEKSGAAFHLLKPSKFDELIGVLEEILSKQWNS